MRYFVKDNVLFTSVMAFDNTYTEITEDEYIKRLNDVIDKRATFTNNNEEDLEEILVEVEEVVEDVLFE